jgi:hypothetical protein
VGELKERERDGEREKERAEREKRQIYRRKCIVVSMAY